MILSLFRRSLPALLWLVAGIAAGGWLARGERSPFFQSFRETAGHRTGPGHEARSSESARSRTRPAAGVHSVTLQQLGRLANQDDKLPNFDQLIAILSGVTRVGVVSEERRDETFRGAFETAFQSFGFNEAEKAGLLTAFKQGCERMRDLETESVEIRETNPGSLILDFDALADARSAVFEAMRQDVEKVIGARGLADLDVLGGFEDFTAPPEDSLNCEWRIERHDDFWRIWLVVPGPGGREASSTSSPVTTPLADVLRDSLSSAQGGRFAHLQDRLPAQITPPP